MTRDWRPGATISASTIRIHTLDAVFFISVRKARKRLDRASWLVSCRLVSFPSFWIWGNCPNWTWAFSRMMNIPAHLMLDKFVQHSRFTPSSSRTITRDPCTEQSSHTHTSPHLILRHPWASLNSVCSYDSRAINQSQHSTAAPERPPANQTVRLSHPVGKRLDPTGLLSRLVPSRQTHLDWNLCLSRLLPLLGTVLKSQAGRMPYLPCTAG